jgi:hypothetical protein
MMAKRKGKNRQCSAACLEIQATRRAARTAGLPLTVPLSIPAYWTPEEALAVFELIDDLRDRIWSIYQNDLQEEMRQQRQSGPVEPIHIDEDDLPF